ncbi:MAG: tetraacyldisaccharide 4'-kinase [Pirellulales bacterium]|nr:tetraacyldisaccharide 4'-kinase [Pirellulales bacterium]
MVASVSRAILAGIEVPYALSVAWRNRRYDRGQAETYSAGVPVISVGNLTLGGTGKTPMVRWIAQHVQALGRRVAILSRGYGTSTGNRNDEALELESTAPEILHLQNPDRVAAAQIAVRDHRIDTIVLDDGFQHRRLARDLDIVLLDATNPFGYGRIFPRGLLRESALGLARANGIVLSRADVIDPESRLEIQKQVERLAPRAFWCEASHAPQSLVNTMGDRQSWTLLEGEPVAAFCGIGSPLGFRRTLESCGIHVAAWRVFPDHHSYSARDIAALANWAQTAGTTAVLCTQKDLVKINQHRLGNLPLWAMAIEIEFHIGLEWMHQAVDRILLPPKS